MFNNQSVLQRHIIIDYEKQKLITLDLARTVVDAKLSLKFVENTAFHAYSRTLNHHAPIVSRRALLRTIEEDFARTLPQIIQHLKYIGSKIELTCNVWTSTVFRNFFTLDIGQVCTGERVSWIFSLSTTAKSVLNAILLDWGLESKVRCVTTDSGSEMGPAMGHVKRILNE